MAVEDLAETLDLLRGVHHHLARSLLGE